MPLASKPISAYRPQAREPVPWPNRGRVIEKPPLWQFVFLSMVLHALFITMFGAPSGGSREGRALWGALEVELPGLQPEAVPTLKLDRGAAIERLREALTPRSERPPAPAKPRPRVERVAPRVEPPRAPLAPADVPPLSMPPVLDRILKPDRKLETPPALRVPLPTREQIVRPIVPVIPAPSPTPAEAPAPAEPAPRVERVPAEAAPIPAPVVQPAPLPVPERLATPPPAERATVETPVVPPIPTPPVERAPIEVPAIPVPSLESITPLREEAAPKPVEKATAQEIPVTPTLPPAAERAPPPVQEREAPARTEREPPVSAEPALRPSPFRAPDSTRPRGDEPSTTYDPTAGPPSIDLDAVRKRAAALARQGTGNRAVLPFPMPPLPERKTKEQIAIENARKPDCRTAYSSLGLAAVVPLIANEFGEGNCRW